MINRLVERHLFSSDDVRYKELIELCARSKDVYNAGLSLIMKYRETNDGHLFYYSLCKEILRNIDSVEYNAYRKLPSSVSQQTLKILDNNFKSYFKVLSNNKENINKTFIGSPQLIKDDGHFTVVYTLHNISKIFLRQNKLKLTDVSFIIKTKQSNIKEVRIVPKNGCVAVDVIYTQTANTLKQDNGKYAAIDFGIKNLITLASNVANPIIYRGGTINSINSYYLTAKSKILKDLSKDNIRHAKSLDKLVYKRWVQITNYLHKLTHNIISYLVLHNINTLVIGYNKGWKEDFKANRKLSSLFYLIPFYKLVKMLRYKCYMKGINVIITEESYTSKCSFLDGESVSKRKSYKGKRVKRGKFKSNDGVCIHADVNGALNILRKKFPFALDVYQENIWKSPKAITIHR